MLKYEARSTRKNRNPSQGTQLQGKATRHKATINKYNQNQPVHKAGKAQGEGKAKGKQG